MSRAVRKLYLMIHVLQAMPASCINRDDAGSPKSFPYGGTIRASVSSQAWKRAAKMYLKEMGEDTGLRTRAFQQMFVEMLISDGAVKGMEEDEIKNFVKKSMVDAGLLADEKDKKPATVYLSQVQIDAVVALMKKKLDEKDNYEDDDYKKDLKKAISDNPTGDMLLFGRMMACEPSLSYDAACQVAYAFTVNEAREEYDYFTAVDEFVTDNKGAAHIDSKSYNSGVYYRYASVNLSDTSELIRMDKPHAAKIARDFAEAFVRSIPLGGSNSFANTTVPDVVMIELRAENAASYSPAFIEAVTGNNYMKEAEDLLMAYAKKVDRNFEPPVLRLTFDDMSFKEMLNKVEETIQEVI